MRKDIFGLAGQTALGVAESTMDYFVPVEAGSTGQSRETIEQEETTGSRFPTGVDYGGEYWAPQLNGAARYNSLPRILSGFAGAPISSQPNVATSPTAWSHLLDTYVTDEALVPHSLAVVRKDPTPDISDLLSDALGDEIALSVEPNGFLQWEGTWIARTLAELSPVPVPTYDASRRITFDECKAFLTIDGGPENEIPIGSFSLTYTNGIATDDWVLGSRKLFTVEPGNAGCEVSFMPRDTLNAHYRRALQADPSTLKLRLVALGPEIGASTPDVNYKLEVITYALETLEAPADINAAERLKTLEVTARAKVDEVANKFVDFIVVNEVASYAVS